MPCPASRWTEEVLLELKAVMAQGYSMSQAAAKFGCTKNSVAGALSRLRSRGEKVRAKGPGRAFEHGEKDEIVRRYRNGEMLKALARAYSRSRAAIRAVINDAGMSVRRVGAPVYTMKRIAPALRPGPALIDTAVDGSSFTTLYFEATSRQCRFVVDDPRDKGLELRCCGAPIKDGQFFPTASWCAEHHALTMVRPFYAQRREAAGRGRPFKDDKVLDVGAWHT